MSDTGWHVIENVAMIAAAVFCVWWFEGWWKLMAFVPVAYMNLRV